MNTARSDYRPTLDGWRAIAILGVIVCHAASALEVHNPRALRITETGAKGVDLFFAISGFLITSRLLDEFRSTGRIHLGAFYVRRAFRILPPFLAYITVILIGAALGGWVLSMADIITSLTLTRNYLAPFDDGSWYTGHLWSLSVEEHFYLLWPALLILCRPRWGGMVAFALAILVVIWAIVEFRLQLLQRVLPDAGYYVRTDICLGKLLFAAAAAVFLDQQPALARRIFPPWSATLIVFVLLAVIAIRPPLSIHLESVLFAALISATVVNPRTILGNALEFAPMRWIGKVSYSLYLWQQFFLPESPVLEIQRFPWCFPGMIVAAVGSYFLIEQPMIGLGRRLLSRTRDRKETVFASSRL